MVFYGPYLNLFPRCTLYKNLSFHSIISVSEVSSVMNGHSKWWSKSPWHCHLITSISGKLLLYWVKAETHYLFAWLQDSGNTLHYTHNIHMQLKSKCLKIQYYYSNTPCDFVNLFGAHSINNTTINHYYKFDLLLIFLVVQFNFYLTCLKNIPQMQYLWAKPTWGHVHVHVRIHVHYAYMYTNLIPFRLWSS